MAHVHAAITFVNELPGAVRPPETFTLAIGPHWSVDDIRDVLVAKLRLDIPDATRAYLLEKYPTTPMKLYLWVTPQGDDKLCLWQRGSLEQFLHVAADDRKLCVQARLSLSGIAGAETDPTFKLDDDDLSSEDDDLDNTLRSPSDGSQSGSSIFLTPESESGNRYLNSTTPVTSLPPRMIDNRPQCSVIVDFDTTNLPSHDNELYRPANYTIPLDATPHFLSTMILSHACKLFRDSQQEMMLALQAAGKGLHMRSSTAFKDERDSYLRRDEIQSCRIAKLSDLFLNRRSLKKSPEIPIIVKIDIIDIDPEAKDLDSAHYSPMHLHYGFHRIATAAPVIPPVGRLRARVQAANTPDPQEQEQLKPHQVAHIAHYPRRFPMGGPLYGIPCREINGILIGDTREADPAPVREEQIWEDKYNQFEGPEAPRERQEAIWRDMCASASDLNVPEGVPVLPSLTFLPYTGEGVKLAEEKIHVAVRIVNSLNKIAVPVGVVVKVTDGVEMKEVICQALVRKMKDVYIKKNMRSAYKMMEDEGKWRWDLWVLPQKVDDEALMMYRFKEGSLVKFLDEEMVKDGSRTLYMEAHIVG